MNHAYESPSGWSPLPLLIEPTRSIRLARDMMGYTKEERSRFLSLEMDNDVAVPLGTGLPTRAELEAYYPAKFTWHQLKTFVNSGYTTMH